MKNANTSGVGLLSKRVRKTPSSRVSTDRYEWLKLEDAEPDLGIPNADGSLLISNRQGTRNWVDTVKVTEAGNLVLEKDLNVKNVKISNSTITTITPNSNLYVSTNGNGSIQFLNDVKHNGNLLVNGGNLSSSNIGFNLLNSTVQTINFGGVAADITIGNANTDITIPGNLTVVGEYIYNTPQISVIEDYILVLGSTPSPQDTTSNGGGIELLGTTTKSLKWYDATDAWTSSENFDLAIGKSYLINGNSVLSASTLGSSVLNSSLTSVGILSAGTWKASTIGTQYGGTGLIAYSAGDMLYADTANSLSNLELGPVGSVLVSNGIAPTWDTSLSLVGDLSTIGIITVNNDTISSSKVSGALIVQGGVGIGGAVYAGSLQGTPIGNISRSSASFTYLNANNSVIFTKNQSSTNTTSGTLVVTGGAGFSENVNVGNDLTVGGSLLTSDRVLTIGGIIAPGTNDSKDRGIEFRWHNGISSKLGFFGFSNSTGKLTFIPTATNTNDVYSGTKGEIDAQLDWNNLLNIPPEFDGGGFGTIYVLDTDSGFTWAETGTITSTTNHDLTFISGAGIDLDADITNNAIRVSHADTSSVANLTAQSRRYVSGLTFDTYGHVSSYSTAIETDVTNIVNNTASNETYYPVFSTITTGAASSLAVSTSKLTFNPFLGLLTAVDLNTSSDENLKENIETILNPLDTIKQLQGKTFNWKESGKKSYGVIAQELEKILPELVHNDANGIKHVSYIPMIALLIEAVKQQQSQIDYLIEQINNPK